MTKTPKRWIPRVPELKPGTYADGAPLPKLTYLAIKLILRGDRFVSSQSLRDFRKYVAKAAKLSDVDFDIEGYEDGQTKIREVLFLDTPDFLLYKNAMMLRRRFLYQDGFLVGDPEIVLKYRSPDLQKAAETDVRPRINGPYIIKFKAQAMPKKERLGGYRLLFSHAAQFSLSSVRQVNRKSMATILEVFPVLQPIIPSTLGEIQLVNNIAVEELLVDIGTLNFGKGQRCKCNVSLWRKRGDLGQLVGEFAFQLKFADRTEVHPKVVIRCEKFLKNLQRVAADWITLGTTKTGSVYNLLGKTQSQE